MTNWFDFLLVKPLEMPTGIDIYVDNARFLPDNVGMSRIFVSVRKRNRAYAHEEATTVADINSSTRNPAYAVCHSPLHPSQQASSTRDWSCYVCFQ
jgi:hypothetical protein